MKTTLALAALFILVLGGGYAYYNQVNAIPVTYPVTATDTATSSSTATDTTAPAGTTVTTITVQPSKTPVATTPKPTGYTLAVVATHNTTGSCWTAIDGNVYDLTSWINQHPGGKSAILSICGKDGSAAFNGQHGGDGRAASELATFKLGALES